MAHSKATMFSKDEIVIAAMAKALAHPARIKILRILTQTNACMCGEIVELMPLAQATVSQHLKELKKVNLIKGSIEGPKICYCLDNEQLEKARQLFDNLFKMFTQN
jgi:DNA-binding transcriptional ArsR family regulator